MQYVLAIDQGTSSTKSIIFDQTGNAVAKGHADLQTNYFDNGFVEQDPEGIYENVLESVSKCLQSFQNQGFSVENIASCGISNQRETFVVWDKSGHAQAPAVVWACKRSIDICQKLKAKGQESFVNERTGLIIDPYFSATKLLWLLENKPELKQKLDAGELYFGTIDCWILYKMTDGKSFKTDYTNAHRTLLFNIHTLTWDQDILRLWGLEKLNLPTVHASSYDFGSWCVTSPPAPLLSGEGSLATLPLSRKERGLGGEVAAAVKITALIGDSHAATFGEGCFEKGTAKVTMGTGSSIMMNTGDKPVMSKNGMLATVCWSVEGRVDYALEGAIVACGSTIEWLKNELQLFKDSSETEAMATAVADNSGVYLIPAFSGLGGPHWQMNRRASIEGMTFGTTRNHIVRAGLESIAYQIKDVVAAMSQDMGTPLAVISANGGITRNAFVMHFLVDLLGIPVKKQQNADVSALGAAYLSGLKSGVYKSIDQLKQLNDAKTETILPDLSNTDIQEFYKIWQQKIRQSQQ